MPHVRVCGYIDTDVAHQVLLEHKERVALAQRQGVDTPNFSEVMQDILKKGIISVRAKTH